VISRMAGQDHESRLVSALGEGSVITTERLTLTPLSPEDADEMVAVLGDRQLHEFIGGRPATLDELRERFERLVAGSTSPNEVWLNWIVRRTSDSQPVGTVQATMTNNQETRTALVAWVIGSAWQKQGFASEAARALVDWLHHIGGDEVIAHIHPDHRASAIVAARAGLLPTADEVEGEQVWRRSGEGDR
jgi:RimJ/RimL family protein N-acetyltransferase